MHRLIVSARLVAAASALLFSAAGTPVEAQGTKPARIIVGVPPGSSFDTVARILAEHAAQSSGRQFIVENRPGAGGTIAAETAARASADGSTLFLSPLSAMVTEPIVNPKNVRYDPFKDFAPVSLLATIDIALAVGPALPVASFADWLAAVRADPERGFFTSPGINGQPYFLGVQIARRSNVKLTHVPFGGPAPAVQAVLGGQVPALLVAYSDVITHHRAGRFRILATSGPARVPLTPDVPTLTELGIPLQVSAWYGLFVPAAVPAETVARLNKLAVEAARSQKMTDYLTAGGHRIVASAPQELAEALKRDTDFWTAFIRTSGAKVN